MFEVNVRKELHSQFVSKYHNNSPQQSRAVGTGERGEQEGDPLQILAYQLTLQPYLGSL